MGHRVYPINEGHVDWLTGTCLFAKPKHTNAIDEMEVNAMRVIETARLSGDRVQQSRILGFEGLKSGGIFYGRSNQGVMIRLSGHVAAAEWSSFYPLLSNVTRIDVAVTVETRSEDTDLAVLHCKEALEYQNKTAPKFKVVHINGHRHGSSLMLGSRQSESYARIYDKWKESGLEVYRRCWRYEIEFKKRAATQVAFAIAQAPESVSSSIGIVYDWFHRRNVRPAFAAEDITRIRLPRASADVDRSLIWLATQVGPAVRKLLDQGYEREVQRALFGSQAIQPNRIDDAVKRTNWSREEDSESKWERE